MWCRRTFFTLWPKGGLILKKLHSISNDAINFSTFLENHSVLRRCKRTFVRFNAHGIFFALMLFLCRGRHKIRPAKWLSYGRFPRHYHLLIKLVSVVQVHFLEPSTFIADCPLFYIETRVLQTARQSTLHRRGAVSSWFAQCGVVCACGPDTLRRAVFFTIRTATKKTEIRHAAKSGHLGRQTRCPILMIVIKNLFPEVPRNILLVCFRQRPVWRQRSFRHVAKTCCAKLVCAFCAYCVTVMTKEHSAMNSEINGIQMKRTIAPGPRKVKKCPYRSTVKPISAKRL